MTDGSEYVVEQPVVAESQASVDRRMAKGPVRMAFAKAAADCLIGLASTVPLARLLTLADFAPTHG